MRTIVFIILSALYLIVSVFGPIFAFIFPAYWAYNIAQRGDSFGYAIFTFFGNWLILQILVMVAGSAILSLSEKLAVGKKSS